MIRSAIALIYSVAAARRIFSVPPGVRVRVVKFWRCVWLHIAGQRPRFVSLAVFKQHFASRRQKEGAALEVAGAEQRYLVSNPAKATSYYVELAAFGPVCGCADYRNQQKFLGKGICKHGYSVLQRLGYDSLSQYLGAA